MGWQAGPLRATPVAAAVLAACAGGGASSGSSAGSLGSSLGSSAETSDTTGTGDGSTGEPGTTEVTNASTAAGSGSTDGSTGDGPCEETTWYFDGDGDGRGDPAVVVQACAPPAGHVPFGDDCDDGDAARNPAATEICDGIDNDCNDVTDEASARNTACGGCTLFAATNRSYGFCPDGNTWDGARGHCAGLGGDLLRVDDAAENAAIAALAEPPSVLGGGWFIGLSDGAAEGSFVWIDGGALDFVAWLPGEPNDAGGDEDCAEMDQAGGGWNDIPCSTPRAFICETLVP